MGHTNQILECPDGHGTVWLRQQACEQYEPLKCPVCNALMVASDTSVLLIFNGSFTPTWLVNR